MERTFYLLVFSFVFGVFTSYGQANYSIYHAYISGNMNAWKTTLDSLYGVPKKTNQEQLDLINFQYGYIAWCIDNERDSEATAYLRKAEGLLTQLEKQKINPSMLHAYTAAFVGFKIGLAPYKAPFIGPASADHANQSVLADSTNAFGYVQLGNVAFYTPQVFGGSKTEAINYYLKALYLICNENTVRIVFISNINTFI